MKKKSERIQSIIGIKEIEEKKSLEAFANAQKSYQQKQKQLTDLLNYRLDYIENYRDKVDKGLSIKRLLEYRSFLDKLDKAIEEQQQVVKQGEYELLRKRRDWEKIHFNIKGLEKVSDSALTVEKKQKDKQEQFEQDDRVSSVGQRGKGGIESA